MVYIVIFLSVSLGIEVALALPLPKSESESLLAVEGEVVEQMEESVCVGERVCVRCFSVSVTFDA